MDYGFGHALIFTFINVLNNPSLITNSIIHTSYVLLKYYHCEYTLLQFEKTLFFFELLSSFSITRISYIIMLSLYISILICTIDYFSLILFTLIVYTSNVIYVVFAIFYLNVISINSPLLVHPFSPLIDILFRSIEHSNSSKYTYTCTCTSKCTHLLITTMLFLTICIHVHAQITLTCLYSGSCIYG